MGQAGLYVQRAVNFICEIQSVAPAGSKSPAIAVDGVVGPQTLEKLNTVDAEAMLQELRNLSKAHYEHVAAANPRFAGWLEGSLKRADV